jgi:PilZ domain
VQANPPRAESFSGQLTDQRACERTECYLQAVAPGNNNSFRRVVTLDLSEGGARLIIDPHPQLGETLRWMYVLDKNTIFWTEATIVHVDGVSVGCRFARPLYQEEMALLLATVNHNDRE